jgi:hypothetical protein
MERKWKVQWWPGSGTPLKLLIVLQMSLKAKSRILNGTYGSNIICNLSNVRLVTFPFFLNSSDCSFIPIDIPAVSFINKAMLFLNYTADMHFYL